MGLRNLGPRMDSIFTTRRMFYWGLFALIAATLLFIRLLPLDLTAGTWPGPHWIVAIGYSWVLRRPNFIPVVLFALVMLINDLMLMRPPGLWTGLSVIGLEFLRARAQFSRELPFLIEWAMVSGVLAALMISNRVILAIFIVPQPILGLDMILLLGTILLYPLVVFVSSFGLGVRKVAPGAVDDLGHRI